MALSKITTASISTAAATSNTNIDDGTLFVDVTNNRVGVGTTSPEQALHVKSPNGQILAEATSSNPSLKLRSATNNRNWEVFSWAGNAGEFGVYDGVAQANRLIIDTSGRVTLPYQPCFMAVSTDTANTINGTKMNFNTIGQAGAIGYSTANQRFTAPVAGKYLFMCNIWFYNTGYSNQVVLRVNNNELNWAGDTHIMCNGSNSVDCMTGGATILQLSAGDYVELFARSGYSVRWYGRHSSWSGHLLG